MSAGRLVPDRKSIVKPSLKHNTMYSTTVSGPFGKLVTSLSMEGDTLKILTLGVENRLCELDSKIKSPAETATVVDGEAKLNLPQPVQETHFSISGIAKLNATHSIVLYRDAKFYDRLVRVPNQKVDAISKMKLSEMTDSEKLAAGMESLDIETKAKSIDVKDEKQQHNFGKLYARTIIVPKANYLVIFPFFASKCSIYKVVKDKLVLITELNFKTSATDIMLLRPNEFAVAFPRVYSRNSRDIKPPSVEIYDFDLLLQKQMTPVTTVPVNYPGLNVLEKVYLNNDDALICIGSGMAGVKACWIDIASQACLYRLSLPVSTTSVVEVSPTGEMFYAQSRRSKHAESDHQSVIVKCVFPKLQQLVREVPLITKGLFAGVPLLSHVMTKQHGLFANRTDMLAAVTHPSKVQEEEEENTSDNNKKLG